MSLHAQQQAHLKMETYHPASPEAESTVLQVKENSEELAGGGRPDEWPNCVMMIHECQEVANPGASNGEIHDASETLANGCEGGTAREDDDDQQDGEERDGGRKDHIDDEMWDGNTEEEQEGQEWIGGDSRYKSRRKTQEVDRLKPSSCHARASIAKEKGRIGTSKDGGQETVQVQELVGAAPILYRILKPDSTNAGEIVATNLIYRISVLWTISKFRAKIHAGLGVPCRRRVDSRTPVGQPRPDRFALLWLAQTIVT